MESFTVTNDETLEIRDLTRLREDKLSDDAIGAEDDNELDELEELPDAGTLVDLITFYAISLGQIL